MRLRAGQRRALEAIADTFAPGGAGLPSARQVGVPEAMVQGITDNARASEPREIAQLLALWNTRLVTAVGGGGMRGFSDLPQERREQVLRSWCDSRLPQRRA